MIRKLDSDIVLEQRIEYYDICKGIAAFCVILQHFVGLNQAYMKENILFSILQYFHMPVFFFISGYFGKSSIQNQSFKRIFVDKFWRLLVPFFAWSALALSLKYMELWRNGNFTLKNGLIQIVKVIIYAESVWYFIAIFYCFIFIKLLFIMTKQNTFLIIITCVVVISIPIKINFFVIYKIQELFIFFVLGIFTDDRLITKIRNFFNKYFLFFFVIGSSILIPLSKAYYIYSENWVHFVIVQIVADFCGLLYIITIIASIIEHVPIFKKVLNNFGKHSMELYCIHMPLLRLVPGALILRIQEMPLYIHYLYYILYAYIVAQFCWWISVNFLNKFKIYRILMLGEGVRKHG